MAKKKGGGHHGGAWKVAYADFVTAMMALFMVLWICGQNEEVKQATSRFFQDPYNMMPEKSSGLMSNQIAGANKDTPDADPTAEKDTGYLQALAKDFYRLLNVPEEEEKPVSVEVTSDGLKITLYNRAKRPVFVQNTAEFTEWGRFVVQTLAWLVERHEFRVYIDGHSERGAKMNTPDYGPWELSADRANAARRSLQYYAVEGRKFERVTGFGDTVPLPGVAPEAESNARITVSLSLQQEKRPTKNSTPISEKAAEKIAEATKSKWPDLSPFPAGTHPISDKAARDKLNLTTQSH